MVKPVNAMSMDALSHLICFEVISLVRSDSMWNAVTVNKALSSPLDGSFRHKHYVQGRQIYI